MGRTRGFDETTVLRTVRDQFWDTGYEGTSTYDLMDATGLGKGSIYLAFGNKHELYLRVFADYCDDIVGQVRQALADGPGAAASPLQRLERYVLSLAHAFAAESPHRGCFLSKATADLAGADPAVAERARDAFDRIAGTLAEAIGDAQRAGEIDAAADPRTLGYLLLTVIRGIDCVAKAGVDRSTLSDTARAAVALLPRPVA
ncbi:MAG TPA: TetR/AcrR family transcriptional regulator [Pseudonocardia sp.]|nr:TetR/AcrR family transcriptional regulator [Pseudonocardia sp.]